MLNRWKRGEHPDDGPALPWARMFAQWAAYSLMLAFGVLLFGVSPNADAPVVPPTRHGVHPAHVPAQLELGTHRQRCTPRPAVPSLCDREPTPYGHGTVHGPQTRLSPKELSLAKW